MGGAEACWPLYAKSLVLVGVILGRKTRPLYGVEGWPRNRGSVSTIYYSGTKVNVCYRRSGHLSRVVVKRGSTVYNVYTCGVSCINCTCVHVLAMSTVCTRISIV